MYEFYHKVKGVTHRSIDYEQISAGDEVQLVLEPDNPVHDEAIKVYHMPLNGDEVDPRAQGHIGYLPWALAEQYFERLDNEEIGYNVWIEQVTGGTPRKPNHGINLFIQIADISAEAQ